MDKYCEDQTMRCPLTAGFWLAVAVCVLTGPSAKAQSLETLLENAIQTDHRVIGAKADVAAASERAREALGDWFPLFEPTANHGYELIQNPHDSDTGLPFSEIDISLTQKLWDFGTTNALVEKARLELVEKQLTLTKVKEDLILEGINAYVNLFKVYHSLAFARQSKDNVQKQTGLEVAKVESGSGLSTDVLQAKSQLAGAIAREIQSEGALLAARNRYRAVFGKAPVPEKMLPVALPLEHLSQTLEEAIERALENNTQIAIDSIGEAIARQDYRNSYSDNFFPKLEGVLTQKWKNNVSGTTDLKKETLAKIEMTMPFNLGFTAINTLRAAENDIISSSRVVAQTRLDIEEQVRNAWQELNTAKLTARSLQNQSDISAAFLELARQERKLGQRSLIDVLSGETTLLNSQSDSISAETDVIIAAFKLLNVTGDLKENFITRASSTQPPALPTQSELPPIETKKTRPEPEQRALLTPRNPPPVSPERPVQNGTEHISREVLERSEHFARGVRDIFRGKLSVQDKDNSTIR